MKHMSEAKRDRLGVRTTLAGVIIFVGGLIGMIASGSIASSIAFIIGIVCIIVGFDLMGIETS